VDPKFSGFSLGKRRQLLRTRRRSTNPGKLKTGLNGSPYGDIVRYEVRLAYNRDTNLVEFEHERVILAADSPITGIHQRDNFPESVTIPNTILWPRTGNFRTTLKKVHNGYDNIYSEIKPAKGRSGSAPTFTSGPRKSALGILPVIHFVNFWFMASKKLC
jgi:hypothetical protein